MCNTIEEDIKLISDNELGRHLYEVGYKTGTFKLRSGAVSNEYFDKYAVLSDCRLANAIAASIGDKLLWNCGGFANLPPYFGFLELGAIPLAVSLLRHYQLRISPKILFIRKKPKLHGTCRAIEGAYSTLQDQRVVLVEDVITTGGAVLNAVTSLRMAGATVEDVYCIIDREAENGLKANGLKLHALFSMEGIKKLGEKSTGV